MSSDRDALPPATAPLAEKLAAAMARSGDYDSARALGKALNTDGSLVGKWLNGDVKRITQREHLRRLPKLLQTPESYFSGTRSRERLEVLEEQVEALRSVLVAVAVQLDVEVPEVLRRDGEQAL